MSLMSWSIWSSSLATASGVAGTLACAVAELEAEPGDAVELEPEGEAPPDSTVDTEADADAALDVGSGVFDGACVALCWPQPATASATTSVIAATVAGRAWWRITFSKLSLAPIDWLSPSRKRSVRAARPSPANYWRGALARLAVMTFWRATASGRRASRRSNQYLVSSTSVR